VVCLGLLSFALIERAAHLTVSPEIKLAELWAERPAKPTGLLILVALSHLRLVPVTTDEPAEVPRLPPLQTRLVELLDIDPRDIAE